MSIVHRVHDRRYRHPSIASWRTEPLIVEQLTEKDVGRTVIYTDYGRAEAGTIVSWRDTTVFARFSGGDTAAGCDASDLAFGVGQVY